MTEEIDAVLFDLGGTLIHLEPSKEVVFHRALIKHGHRASLEEVTKAINAAERRFDEETKSLDGVHEDRFWKRYDDFVLDRVGYKGDRSKFAKDASCDFEKIVSVVDNWIEYEDTRPFLNSLKRRDLKIGMISNATDLARKVMDNLNLTRLFDPIVISSEVGFRKPDKRIFLLAAKKAKIPPSRSIYVGDRYAVDVVGARSAGMNSILIDRENYFPDVECLKVRSLKELGRYL